MKRKAIVFTVFLFLGLLVFLTCVSLETNTYLSRDPNDIYKMDAKNPATYSATALEGTTLRVENDLLVGSSTGRLVSFNI